MPDNLHNVMHTTFSVVLFFFFNFSSSLQLLFRHLCHAQLFVTPSTVACQALLSSTISQSLLKVMSIESAMLSNHLIRCHPFSFFFNFSQYQGLFQQVGSSHLVAKVLEIQFHQQSFQWCCSKSIMFLFFEKMKWVVRIFYLVILFWHRKRKML